MNRPLFLIQRLSATVLLPLVLIHLVLMLLVAREGLSAEAVLARTQGSFWWGLFYSLFVIAASLHAPIGVRNLLLEWAGLSERVANRLALAFCALLLIIGARAVIAVIAT